MKKETKFKIKKISNKRDKILIGHFEKLSKEAAERIDKHTLRVLIEKYSKDWVNKELKQ